MLRSRLMFLLAALVAASALMQGCSRQEKADTGSKVVLTMWHPWGGTQSEAMDDIIKAFEAAHPDIDVKPLYTPNNLSNNQKFFTSVAAKRPPDVVFVDGPQVAEWAEQGALETIDTQLATANLSIKDYFEPCWRQNEYKDHVWGLTYCADPNFAFVWNKKDFRDAGLDPNAPPKTIAELDKLVGNLNKIEGRKFARIGLIPWGQYGSANSLFTWGWAFGGSFYDSENHKVTCDDPKIVKALEWMCSYAKKYDINKIASMQAGFGTAELNPLYVGKLSLSCLHISGIEDIKKYAPGMEYGVSYIPAPPGGEPHSSWVGGWCMAIPKGSKHPKEAWELMRWMCADSKGTSLIAEKTGLFPAYRHSPYFAKIRTKPGYDMFLKILEECRHQRPVMPAQAYYMGALQRAVDDATYGKKTPKQALTDARIETQRELDLVLGE